MTTLFGRNVSKGVLQSHALPAKASLTTVSEHSLTSGVVGESAILHMATITDANTLSEAGLKLSQHVYCILSEAGLKLSQHVYCILQRQQLYTNCTALKTTGNWCFDSRA